MPPHTFAWGAELWLARAAATPGWMGSPDAPALACVVSTRLGARPGSGQKVQVAPAGGTPQARDPNLTPRSDSSTQGPARHLGSVAGGQAGATDPARRSTRHVSVFSRSPGQGPARRAGKLHPGKRDQPQRDGTIPCEAQRAWS